MNPLTEIKAFLACETPKAWVEEAVRQQETLLIDHAHCEKKAASSALSLLYRYPDKTALLHKMSRLAREELRHFEQVLAILENRGIAYEHLSPARYAAGLRAATREAEPGRLVDSLVIGAYIEARSCERFGKLIPFLDEELAKFYSSLLKSEARHFQDYLQLAAQYSPEPITERVALFAAVEAELITNADEIFRFHSGVPV